jgi:hypothetical protein
MPRSEESLAMFGLFTRMYDIAIGLVGLYFAESDDAPE